MSYEDKTKLYTWKEMETVLKALSKLEKESKPALKLEELVKEEIKKPVEHGAYGDDKFCDEYSCGIRYNSKLQSLVNESQNTNKEEGKTT